MGAGTGADALAGTGASEIVRWILGIVMPCGRDTGHHAQKWRIKKKMEDDMEIAMNTSEEGYP